jgi:hypothetical protein
LTLLIRRPWPASGGSRTLKRNFDLAGRFLEAGKMDNDGRFAGAQLVAACTAVGKASADVAAARAAPPITKGTVDLDMIFLSASL